MQIGFIRGEGGGVLWRGVEHDVAEHLQHHND